MTKIPTSPGTKFYSRFQEALQGKE